MAAKAAGRGKFRVMLKQVGEKTNSSEFAIDGRLLGEASEEKGIAGFLRDAVRDFKDHQDCPDEEALATTWPAFCDQLQKAGAIRSRASHHSNASHPKSAAASPETESKPNSNQEVAPGLGRRVNSRNRFQFD